MRSAKMSDREANAREQAGVDDADVSTLYNGKGELAGQSL